MLSKLKYDSSVPHNPFVLLLVWFKQWTTMLCAQQYSDHLKEGIKKIFNSWPIVVVVFFKSVSIKRHDLQNTQEPKYIDPVHRHEAKVIWGCAHDDCSDSSVCHSPKFSTVWCVDGCGFIQTSVCLQISWDVSITLPRFYQVTATHKAGSWFQCRNVWLLVCGGCRSQGAAELWRPLLQSEASAVSRISPHHPGQSSALFGLPLAIGSVLCACAQYSGGDL